MPTGNLDSGNAREVIRRLQLLNAAGSTVVLVTHDTDVADVASRHVFLVDGRVVRDMSHEEVRTS